MSEWNSHKTSWADPVGGVTTQLIVAVLSEEVNTLHCSLPEKQSSIHQYSNGLLHSQVLSHCRDANGLTRILVHMLIKVVGSHLPLFPLNSWVICSTDHQHACYIPRFATKTWLLTTIDSFQWKQTVAGQMNRTALLWWINWPPVLLTPVVAQRGSSESCWENCR